MISKLSHAGQPKKMDGTTNDITPGKTCLPSSHRSPKLEIYGELMKDVASIMQTVTKLKPLCKEMGACVCGGGTKPVCELHNVGKDFAGLTSLQSTSGPSCLSAK